MNTCEKHKRILAGWNADLRTLAEELHRLRYDSVRGFYEHSATELQRQSEGDRAGGREQLADLLAEAARLASELEKVLARIWKLCRPHMKDE